MICTHDARGSLRVSVDILGNVTNTCVTNDVTLLMLNTTMDYCSDLLG